MKFKEAANTGLPLRRRSWKGTGWIQTTREIHFSDDDLQADDWEINRDSASPSRISPFKEAETKIAELEKEIARLKSWEYFKTSLEACHAYSRLSKEHQDMIMLMMDGMKYRKEKNNE